MIEDLRRGYIGRAAAVDIYGLDPETAGAIVARYPWSPARHATTRTA